MKQDKVPEKASAKANKLLEESSPYLLQHAYNPVQWYPWSEEALEKAKAENKMLIISIGYSACHWCHVMEQESFEDQEVADLMNNNFVCIKVDREERPDVDDVYMTACQISTGSGGWPLNAFALPDGRPLYAGTYFPKTNWMRILNQMHELYSNQQEEAEKYANALTEGIQQSDFLELDVSESTYEKSELKNAWNQWSQQLDSEWGGLRRDRNKFPMPVTWNFLLSYHSMTDDEDIWKPIELCLEKMALGGLYDQLCGGFARYSVDAEWKVPHFEKMLYDNAQLLGLYSRAYRKSPNPLFKSVVEETFDFLNRELSHKDGGFFSSLDADSEGEEGKFYAWTKSEFENLLEDDAPLLCAYFEVTKEGNFEKGKSVPYRRWTDAQFAKQNGLKIEELREKVENAKKILFQARNKRTRPGLDDKILSSWNALCVSALCEAYKSFGDEKFLKRAEGAANFLIKFQQKKDGGLYRNFKDGRSSINAYLPDYALLIEAFLQLYQVSFERKWLSRAEALTAFTFSKFYNPENGMFFFTSIDDEPLIARKTEIADNVIPSPNSVMAHNLFDLGHILLNDDFSKKAEQMLRNLKGQALKNPPYFSNWLRLFQKHAHLPNEVVIVGEDFMKLRKAMQASSFSDALWIGDAKENDLKHTQLKEVKGETWIYVCKNQTCKSPSSSVEEALSQMD